jgi:hypothetical protein
MLAADTTAFRADCRRDYVDSLKSALLQAQEQRKKLLAETKEDHFSRRKL